LEDPKDARLGKSLANESKQNSISEVPETVIKVPNLVSPHTIRAFLTGNNFFPNEPSSFVVRFHPTYVYLHPFALAMLAAWGHYWRGKGVPIRCENLEATGIDYAWRMQLFKFLGVKYAPQREEHEESGRFLTRFAD
jgi:hypothetical protein